MREEILGAAFKNSSQVVNMFNIIVRGVFRTFDFSDKANRHP